MTELELVWLEWEEMEWRGRERRRAMHGVSENIKVDGKFEVASSRAVIISSAKSESDLVYEHGGGLVDKEW